MTVPPPLSPEDLVGRRVAGRFRLLSVLGCGGMSWVYRAEQDPMGRIVALKILDPSRFGGDAGAQARLEQEAALLARLHHPHIAEVYDAGRWEGLSFVAVEHVRGASLAELLHGGALAPARALRLCRHLASALREVHAQGLLHRDLSLNNLLVQDAGGPREQLKLVDFGLACAADAGPSRGTVVGSPHSIAPEQLRGEPATVASDVYAAVVALYTALAGLAPFPDADPARVMQRKQAEDAPDLREARPDLALPACVYTLLKQGLSRDPGRRPADAEALERALRFAERALRDRRLWAVQGFVAPRPGPAWWVWAALGLAAGAALGAGAVWAIL